MKFWVQSFIFLLIAAEGADSLNGEQLNEFFSEFVCEEKNALYEVGLSDPCSINPSQNSGTVPLTPVPPPEPKEGHLPVILINKSGQDAYFTFFGLQIEQNCQKGSPLCTCNPGEATFVNFGDGENGEFDSTGMLGGVASPTSVTGDNRTFSKKFTYLLKKETPLTIYLPNKIVSGRAYFSLGEKITLDVKPNSIAPPNPGDSGDPAYSQNYGLFEYTLYPQNKCSDPNNTEYPLNALSIDMSCVGFFGISFQYLLRDGSHRVRFLDGLFFTRDQILDNLRQTIKDFSRNDKSLKNWEKLFIPKIDPPKDIPVIDLPNDQIVRVISPGESMGGGRLVLKPFDLDYFDNAEDYGYSWAKKMWTGEDAYYKNNTLTINIGKYSFKGSVNSSNEFMFKDDKAGETYYIPWIGTNNPLSPSIIPPSDNNISKYTFAAFCSVGGTLPGMYYYKDGHKIYNIPTTNQTRIVQILSSAVIAGILPSETNELNFSGPGRRLLDQFYLPNSLLPDGGEYYGPWFDLYSRGILGPGQHLTGNIVYAFAYDDYLYQHSKIVKNVAPSLSEISKDTYLVIQINP